MNKLLCITILVSLTITACSKTEPVITDTSEVTQEPIADKNQIIKPLPVEPSKYQYCLDSYFKATNSIYRLDSIKPESDSDNKLYYGALFNENLLLGIEYTDESLKKFSTIDVSYTVRSPAEDLTHDNTDVALTALACIEGNKAGVKEKMQKLLQDSLSGVTENLGHQSKMILNNTEYIATTNKYGEVILQANPL